MDGMYTTLCSGFSTLKTWLLWILAPPICAACKCMLAERTVLCTRCKHMITPLVSATIFVNATDTLSVSCIGEYKDPLKKLILAKGHRDYVASHELGQLMYDLTSLRDMQFDIVVPIPLHWSRYARRGYNQAHEMAIAVAERLNIPCVDLLKRTRATALQSSVNHTERVSNVQRAFAFAGDPSLYVGKRILLVDDLMTTGATLKTAAQLLVKLAPASVHAVVACRVR